MAILVTLLILPSVTFAQETGTPEGQGGTDTFYQNGAPGIGSDGTVDAGQGFVPCSGEGCSTCHFAVLANTIIKWFIGIFFLLIAALAVIAGIRLVTSGGNLGAKDAAKKSFTNAIIGLLIIMAAWILVDTIMRGLLQNEGTIEGWGPWSQIQCSEQRAATIVQNVFDGEAVSGTDAANQGPGGTEGTGAGPGVTPSGNLVTYAGRQFDAAVVDNIRYIDENFGLTVSGGHRTAERNAQVNGSPTSYHLSGRAGDFVGSMSEMQKGRDWARANGAREAFIHNAGSGTHLHVAW